MTTDELVVMEEISILNISTRSEYTQSYLHSQFVIVLFFMLLHYIYAPFYLYFGCERINE